MPQFLGGREKTFVFQEQNHVTSMFGLLMFRQRQLGKEHVMGSHGKHNSFRKYYPKRKDVLHLASCAFGGNLQKGTQQEIIFISHYFFSFILIFKGVS